MSQAELICWIDTCLFCCAGTEMSQAELIKRAFAGDDVQADFEASKAAEVEEELPKQASPLPHLFQYRCCCLPHLVSFLGSQADSQDLRHWCNSTCKFQQHIPHAVVISVCAWTAAGHHSCLVIVCAIHEANCHIANG